MATTEAKAALTPSRASVRVAGSDGGAASDYDIFEVLAIDADGATLSGPLLLELGESVELRLELGSTVAARAVVESVSLGERRMQVRFLDLDGEARRALG